MDRNRHEERSSPDEGLIQTIQQAREIAQPSTFSPSITDKPYRAVSIYVSVILAKTGISANQITFLWILLGLVGVVALAAPSYVVRLAGAILIEISYLFDYVDGEVARLQHRSSKRGVFLDLAGHGLIKTAIFLAIGYQVVLVTGRFEYLILAALACVGIANGHASMAYAEVARVTMQPRIAAASSGAAHRSGLRELLNLSGYWFESAGIFAIVLLGAVFDHLAWVLVFYGFLGPLWCVYRLLKYKHE
jgi:phosphatidylglycerophosphate synthase